MATMPAGGIVLHGAAESDSQAKSPLSSSVLIKLNDRLVQDLKKAFHAKERLVFENGRSPKLSIGARSIDLSLSRDRFQNELFASTAGTSATDFTFTSLITHRAELNTARRTLSEETSGTDAALATLQNTLASYEQEKQSKQATITSSILPAPKSRFAAARNEKMDNKKRSHLGVNGFSQPVSPSISATGTPRLGPGPTSAPASEDAMKMQAMRKAIIHLVAIRPATSEEIANKTHIPKGDLGDQLQRVGKQVNGKWELTDRAYKDLEIWKFPYQSREDRIAARERAIKAFDRLRLGKDDALWQTLLPKSERGKGIVLSRLNVGGGQGNRGLTPHYQPSPTPHFDGVGDSRATSAANTPRLGASTPRPGSSKGDVMKRLLSKDPKKARAVEEAKEKKRKEREAAASEAESSRPAKKQATKKTNTNVKSAEFVLSSDDESSVEAELKKATITPNGADHETPKTAAKHKSRAQTSSDSSSDVPMKSAVAVAKAESSTTIEKTAASPAVQASRPTTAGKHTPHTTTTTTNGLSAPNSQSRVQSSPQKPASRPSVPSPLGAARPRVASDVSDRGAIGVQRVKQGTAAPQGLGITNGARARHDTVTSTNGAAFKASDKRANERAVQDKQSQPTMNDKAPSDGMPPHVKTETGNKKKAEDLPSEKLETEDAAKHRKTDSSASQSHQERSSMVSTNGTGQTSPEGSSSHDSAASVLQNISFRQGVALAQKFLDDYYPAYAKMYDEQEAMEARGEKVEKEKRLQLLKMHETLAQMKREIETAAQREHLDD